jgi:peroxiredoxin
MEGVFMPPVSLNKPAPDFKLKSFTGEAFKLSDLHGSKNVLLVFNRTFN